MNRFALPVVIVACGIVTGLAISSGLAEPPAVGDRDAERVTELQKERRDILREAVDQAERGYRAGVVQYSSVSRIKLNWLSAELDAAPDRAARVAVRKRIVLQLRHVEETTVELVNAGQAQSIDLLEAKAARLQAEIELLGEKAEN
jgi:outer membrane protein TolC